MTFFDETKAYWGNQTARVIGAGNNRLTARSVKIFADGAYDAGSLRFSIESHLLSGALRTGLAAVRH